MRTITVEIINEKVLKLLKDLEVLQLIRVRKEKTSSMDANWVIRYKGAMTKQPLNGLDAQLNELRNEWE